MISLSVDGQVVGMKEASDTGEGEDGWNVFVTDLAGELKLSRGSHTVVISSSGGDGCIEIDAVTIIAAESSPRGIR